MKESTLLEMKNKIEAQSRVMQALINEITQIYSLIPQPWKNYLSKHEGLGLDINL